DPTLDTAHSLLSGPAIPECGSPVALPFYPWLMLPDLEAKRQIMKYLHTMVRVTDLGQSLDFYVNKLGLQELRPIDSPEGRYTLVFLAGPGDSSAQIELTYNWDPETY